MAACPEAVHAQGTDVVEVASGDRIRGDVRRLQRGRLSFRTAAAPTPGAQRWAGTIEIVWAEVTSLTSAQNLEIELSSGERFSGSISSPSARQLVVETASGPSRPLDMTQIVRIIPVEDGFRARTTGAIDLGVTLTKAAGARTYALHASAQNRTRAYETQVRFDSWLQRRDEAETLTRNDLGLDVRRFMSGRWFAVGKFGVQEDDELDLEWRVVAGGGVGRTLVQSNAMLLSLEGGLDYDGESYSSQPSADHSVEVFAGVDWDYFSPNWATAAAVVATTYISLERQRARLELDARLRRDAFWSVYWAVNVFESFDSDPPGDRERSDLGLSFTLGWAF